MTDLYEEAHFRLREKFDFFILGLTFSILGLSIQTAKFYGPVWSDIFELVGWLLLLLSGGIGVYRGVIAPKEPKARAGMENTQNNEIKSLLPNRKMEAAKMHFRVVSRHYGAILDALKVIQLTLLSIGMGALIVSRAWQPVLDIQSQLGY